MEVVEGLLFAGGGGGARYFLRLWRLRIDPFLDAALELLAVSNGDACAERMGDWT